MELLFTDLDHTVIYSHRYETLKPVVWVEWLSGRPQSFMTKRTYTFFTSQTWLEVVPVTTRTYEQYHRLRETMERLGWKHSLICNGAILLHDGVEDESWTEESLALSEPDQPAFFAAFEMAKNMAMASDITAVLPFLFYVKSEDAETMYSVLSRRVNLERLSIFRDARKVYCIPKSLNKGNAVKRYLDRSGRRSYIACGDSAFDVSMLNDAALCFYPADIRHLIMGKGRKVSCEGVFSDEICDILERVRKERQLFD